MSLYLEACQIDPMLVPFAVTGPTITPPIKDYIQVSYIGYNGVGNEEEEFI